MLGSGRPMTGRLLLLLSVCVALIAGCGDAQTEPASSSTDVNTLLRDTESRVVRRWVDSTTGARLVVGDFNLPVESAIFRHHWGDLEDAWDAAGNGFGYSKRNGWIRVRIDHTLSTGPLKAVRVKVGKDYGSDHLPVVTEYEY